MSIKFHDCLNIKTEVTFSEKRLEKLSESTKEKINKILKSNGLVYNTYEDLKDIRLWNELRSNKKLSLIKYTRMFKKIHELILYEEKWGESPSSCLVS